MIGTGLATGDDRVASSADGLIDARSEGGLYGRTRVEESLARHAKMRSATGLARAVYEDARAFGTISDDTVVFVVTCLPEE